MKNNRLTLGGLLFFSKNPQQYRPALCIKAIAFYGNNIGGIEYRDSRDLTGTIPKMFSEGMSFFKSNLKHTQAGQNFNSTGILEISEIALEELLQNALIHRDYTKNAPIRLMIFDNRIEIVSPGQLPNGLTIESIKMGNAVVRNNLLISYCSKMMSYRGFGSGIIRAMDNQDNIEFINDESGNQFIVKIPRMAEHLRIPNTENVAGSAGNLDSSTENLDSSVRNLDSSTGNLDSSTENLDSSTENLDSSNRNLDSKNRKRLSGKELEELILKNCTDYLSVEEISNRINKNINYLKNEIIPVLIKAGKLEKLYPAIPNHPNQKYKAK